MIKTLIKNIFNLFPLYKEFKKQIKELEIQNKLLKYEINELKEKNSLLCFPINHNESDDVASKTKTRRMYVAQVAAFHKDILEPKLKSMINTTYSLLEDTKNSREEDLSFKGIIFSYRDLILWGKSMVNEHMSYIAEQSEQSN